MTARSGGDHGNRWYSALAANIAVTEAANTTVASRGTMPGDATRRIAPNEQDAKNASRWETPRSNGASSAIDRARCEWLDSATGEICASTLGRLHRAAQTRGHFSPSLLGSVATLPSKADGRASFLNSVCQAVQRSRPRGLALYSRDA